MIKVDYVGHMGSDLRVVNAARISYDNSSRELEPKDVKLINYLAAHEHMTPFEQCELSVIVACPLYIRSQIHRHRTFSYNEISRRYTSDNLEFYYPEKLRFQEKKNKQGSLEELPEPMNTQVLSTMQDQVNSAVELYNRMIEEGIGKEMARAILPQNLMTKFYMKGNLRNWTHFVRLRKDAHAQLEAQIIAHGVLDLIKQYFPVSYEALSKNSLGVVT